MLGFSNTLVGFLNFITLLASIPIIGAGLWMARSTATCESFLQRPLLILGLVIFLVSLSGFIGSCYNVAWALWVYLVVMLFLIVALMGITVFGFIVTAPGGGDQVSGRAYREYHLDNYSSWMRKRVEDMKYWATIKSCILGSKACKEVVTWTPSDYSTRDMTPIQSGCCKPPTSCNYAEATSVAQDPDCYQWSNDPAVLCYECGSCKAGVMEDVRRSWRKLSVLNIIMALVLIGVYCVGCCAFRNAKRAHGNYPFYGHKGMPRWDFR